MGYENTSLTVEVDQILSEKNRTYSKYRWRAELRVRGEKDPIEILKTLSIDIRRDYVNAYGDEIVVAVAMGGGTFAYDVFPRRKELTITLYREPLEDVSEDIDLTQDINNQTFTAVLIGESAEALEANDLRKQSKFMGDLNEIKTVKFQLIDQALEQIRMQSVGGVFRNNTTADVLKYLLTSVSREIDVDDENAVRGVDMYPPHNTTPQKTIVLPHGLRFTDMPEWITQKCAGIYNSGFGVYLQHRVWYVYPTHDLTRYRKAPKGLTLINVPPNRYPQIERTFRRTPNQTIALVTGQVKHLDPSEARQLNDGNGIRFTDARNVMNGFATTQNNRTLALRANNNNEYVTEQRKNGLNNVHLGPQRITSNTFVELSRMATRNGCYVLAVWENSDPGAIFPGMPVKLMYWLRNEVHEAVGVVTMAHHHIGSTRPGFENSRHFCTTTLQLFLEGSLAWEEETATEEETT